jgi:hypothetical protein
MDEALMKKQIFTTLLLSSLPLIANAALITQDLIATGDNLATYDDVTGNLWVKSLYTKGLTFGQVLDLTQNNYLLSGFEVAYDSQVQALVDEYAFVGGGNGIPWSLDGASLFYNALVSPAPVPQSTGTNAWRVRANGLARQNDPNVGKGYFSYYQAYISDSASLSQVNWTDYGTNDLIPRGDPLNVGGFSGFFLVKHIAEVPEPSSIALLCIGLLGFGFVQRLGRR